MYTASIIDAINGGMKLRFRFSLREYSRILEEDMDPVITPSRNDNESIADDNPLLLNLTSVAAFDEAGNIVPKAPP